MHKNLLVIKLHHHSRYTYLLYFKVSTDFWTFMVWRRLKRTPNTQFWSPICTVQFHSSIWPVTFFLKLDRLFSLLNFQDKWFSVAYPNHAAELKAAFGCKNTTSDCFDRWARWVQAVVWDCPTRWALSGAIKENPSQFGAIYPQLFKEGTCFGGKKTCHCSEVPYIHGEMEDGGFGSRLGAAWMKFFKTGAFDSG